MIDSFFQKQNSNDRNLYIELLDVTGSLSNLFSNSCNPFLHYRLMENIFCKAFKADNLSRSDVSADAEKNGIGIGLKTFLQNNGSTLQKIAEFNKESSILRNLNDLDLINKVSLMRNERIRTTKEICGLSDLMYHIITRSEEYMAIYEEHMDLINIKEIKITKKNDSTIYFDDRLNEYCFNLSKNTLFKRFNTSENNKIFGFKVNILDDPYNFLLTKTKQKKKGLQFDTNSTNSSIDDKEILDYIVLPLYNPRTQEVNDKSGLNQWNANGRRRDENEVYISIPYWIHLYKEGFFDYNTDDNKTAPFNVRLPNKKIISMKVAQQNGKALMSNPNSALGQWILRDILGLKPKEIVTKEQLDIIGIDSVKLSKMKNGIFYLDFLKTGSFEIFEKEIKNT